MNGTLNSKKHVGLLLFSAFIIAVCGILYELLISSIASYFQGSSILHFSIVIGLFLSFMGVGSFLSKYIHHNLLTWFIFFEILLALIGGFSAFLLYFAFSITPYFYGFAFTIIALLGTLIGIEIPILTRIVQRYDTFKNALANVLSFDYLGSLFASILFPLLLLPLLGNMKTAFVIGLLNLGVAITNTLIFKGLLNKFKSLLIFEILIGISLITCLIFSFQIVRFFDTQLYRDEIILSKQTPYQQIVVTRWNQDIRLFIDGNLQFSSRDEHRYHEPLVHVPMGLCHTPENILILGGGDGLAAREVLKHEAVQQLTVVDLDPAITKLATNNPIFKRLTEESFSNPKVTIVNADAYKFIENSSDLYNVVIIDLPDPNNTSLGKLYSTEFYRLLSKRMATGGLIVTQSTSPYFAPEAFWCIHNTLKNVYDVVLPYQTYVPTFGQWGFNLAFAGKGILQKNTSESVEKQVLKHLNGKLFTQEATFEFEFLNKEKLPSLFQFAKDEQRRSTEINTLDNQSLIRYYEKNWNDWR